MDVRRGSPGLDLRWEQDDGGREKTGEGSLKGSCCPPSITAAEPARVTAPGGPLEANHRPFRAEPPEGAESWPGATLQILLSPTNTQNKQKFVLSVSVWTNG